MTGAKSLAALLEEKKDYLSLTEAGTRIKCKLTSHEMPARADAVLSYLNGKKFRKAKEWYTQDYSKYLPFIIPDKKDPRRLFCKLTRIKLNKIPAVIEKHVNGQRFLRLKENYEEREARRGDDNDGEEMEEDDGEEMDDEDDEEDIDVKEEVGKAEAAGVWMPIDELQQISGMIKKKGGHRSSEGQRQTPKGDDVMDEDEDEDEDADEPMLEFGEQSFDSDDSDADLRLYIRERKPVAVASKKKESKASTAPTKKEQKKGMDVVGKAEKKDQKGRKEQKGKKEEMGKREQSGKAVGEEGQPKKKVKR